ncbi:MAG: hypothetical protein A2233_05560 [Candidatus Kerfeldbacteria bacterium RIFOXYA2_FULL_38_24]|uniref:ParB-like N-terminal domain-containing protein n=1 Tax=Candidatus Kerfeldbacteria bacterium RIFOXYB2_FULL_38_14 TaxID=1798547 RepID=A0A1G2BGF1_9BACT|nr:MAG: hypothetical protein A2233_05560 [Candidatus Kerfeldbacteria bacterium RIFOXYA2_FULL_38_24]OGY88293.1 MAG: hypothetical protein A2319_03845 [Candidatus Kerfeldbacteria bacterium RIFOXYB2_FULL_38_14]OGY89733.1 MAG: hypothetical protein A2458_01585 [Candidatus Kerfeldbacteria bacterium RIFOXYC2_FULL_38_9]
MNTGLGRGLSSLIPPKHNQFSNANALSASDQDLQQLPFIKIHEIPLLSIAPNPLQPRQHFDEKNLTELVESIRHYGLLEPVIVTKKGEQYQLVAGERRFRAFKILKKNSIPAIIKTASDLERLELAMIENLQRQDLNPIEKAQGMAKLVNDFGLTQAEAAQKLGVARSSLANAIRLLDLPTEIQLALSSGKISEGHAKILLSLDSGQERLNAFHQLIKGRGLSVQDLSLVVQPKRRSKKNNDQNQDFNLRSLEDSLQSILNTKVSIKNKTTGGKRIIIETYSDEDFKRVLKFLS